MRRGNHYNLSNLSAPRSGRRRSKTSSRTPSSASVIYLIFLSFHEKVWIILEATTEGFSRLLTLISVILPRMLVLIGQHINKPLLELYFFDDNTNAGAVFTYFFAFSWFKI